MLLKRVARYRNWQNKTTFVFPPKKYRRTSRFQFPVKDKKYKRALAFLKDKNDKNTCRNLVVNKLFHDTEK